MVSSRKREARNVDVGTQVLVHGKLCNIVRLGKKSKCNVRVEDENGFKKWIKMSCDSVRIVTSKDISGVQKPVAVSWNREFVDLVARMVASDSGLDVLRSLAPEWDVDKLKVLIEGWSPSALAVVLENIPASKAARLLAGSNASTVAKVCVEWEVTKLVRVIPKLKTRVARKVLGKLYFNSSDRFLTRREVKQILEQFEEDRFNKLIEAWSPSTVRKVMQEECEVSKRGHVGFDDSTDDEESDTDASGEEVDETLGGFIVDDDTLEYDSSSEDEQLHRKSNRA